MTIKQTVFCQFLHQSELFRKFTDVMNRSASYGTDSMLEKTIKQIMNLMAVVFQCIVFRGVRSTAYDKDPLFIQYRAVAVKVF